MGFVDLRKLLFPAMLLLAAGTATAEDPVAETSGPWLGVYLADEVDGGIRIVAVVPGGPASIAGLRSGDLLIEAAEVQLADQAALGRVLAGQGSGQELSLAVLRDGKPYTFQVRPVERAPSPSWVLPRSPALLEPRRWPPPGGAPGLKTVSITTELRSHYGAPRDRGVLVVRVDEDSVGDLAGIEVGDVVVEVGARPVTTPAEVELAIARRDRSAPLEIEVVRERKPLVKTVAAVAPVAPGPSVAERAAHDAHVRNLERSIEFLERRIEELRRQLAELKGQGPARHPDPPANPDR